MKKLLPPIFFSIALIAFYTYFKFKLPPDIEPKGYDSWIQIMSLLTAIISLIAAILSFIATLRQGKKAQGLE